MSNILNHNRVLFTTSLNRRDNWDFYLSDESFNYTNINNGNNLIVNIDLNECGSVWFEKLTSTVMWNNAVNNGLSLKNIGYTGVDNGIILYDKSMITNSMFLDKFLNSEYNIEEGDTALHLLPVNGNNKLYDYSCNITYIDGVQVLECNGGFYQGFWKTEDCVYDILPNIKDGELCFEFSLKPYDLENPHNTLNKQNPNNKGIFFYMGTRSENKWWKYYKIKEDFSKLTTSYFADDYLLLDVNNNENCHSYIRDNTSEELLYNYLQYNGYIDKEYISYSIEDFKTDNIDECKNYFGDDYIESEVELNEDDFIKNSKDNLNKPTQITEIITDNKFLLFDRTKDGFNTSNWIEGTKLIIEKEDGNNDLNYFLHFNRTKDGYTTSSFEDFKEEYAKEYSVLNDLYENAIAFQITDGGAIGYKYMVNDCENNTYKILSEFSYENIVKYNEWSKINILITPLIETNKMIIKIYVNNKLKLVSKNLPLLNFRQLKDDYKKQEGVPYVISLGGGTQGLCDVIYPTYMNIPEYQLPLEKEFGGTFIGYIKYFKIYNNIHNIQELLYL